MTRLLLPLLLFMVVATMLALGMRRDPRALPSALIDRPLPDFEQRQLDEPGRRFSPATMQGRVWLLNVWASWCEPCREELPALRQFATRDDIALIGLNYKDQDGPARALLAGIGNPYQLSAVDADGRIGMDLGVQGVPETFVIDAQGRVRFRHQGPVTAQVWRERLMPVVRSLQ